MTKQEASKLIEHWFESVEIAEYELHPDEVFYDEDEDTYFTNIRNR